jgi:hypothetical protein
LVSSLDIGLSNPGEWGGRFVWGRRRMHAGFWWGNLKERGHFENLGVDGKMILKCILKKAWTWSDWGWRWGSCDHRNERFHKIHGIL